MTRRATAFVCVLLIAVTLAGGAGSATGASSPSLVGIVDHSTYGGEGSLVRFDPVTLRPRAGGRVALGSFQDGWSFSPDRNELVLGFANPSCVGGSTALRFVDTARMRRLGDVPLLPNGTVEATNWLDATHVLAVVQASDCITEKGAIVFAVDAATRTVSSRTPIPGQVVAVVRARDALLLLLAPRNRIGPAQLAVVRESGRVRIAVLGLQAGVHLPYSGGGLAKTDLPGLAVSGDDAFIVPPEGPLAQVDLRTLKVRRLALREARSLQKGATGPVRTVLALGNGLLAVSGWNFGLVSGAPRAAPAGLKLLDPQTRRYRELDSKSSRAALADGVLLADADGATASGLTAYSDTGRLRYRLFAGQPASFIAAVSDRGYAAVGSAMKQRVAAFDLRTGRLVPAGHGDAIWHLLLGEAAPYTAAGF
jgi:hypothetical protein